jgi:hypothetical protein
MGNCPAGIYTIVALSLGETLVFPSSAREEFSAGTMDGVGKMGEVTAIQLVVMKIATEETEAKARIFALMNIVSPFHKSDKAYPIYCIINPCWLYGIMPPLCVTNETATVFPAQACVDSITRGCIETRLLPEDK